MASGVYHTEGVITQRAKRADEGTEFVGAGGLVWQYEYTLKDHLGNTRVTFADLNNSNTIDPNTEINQINHYYPFGLNMEGNWNGASPDAKNKFQYNGKELQSDFGLDWNDYGARNYDAASVRFTTIDPLSFIYGFQSPYAYAANNPVKYIDFMGMSPVGADGMTNEQWMKSSNPANNGSQAANGGGSNSYQQGNRNKEVERLRNGQSREIEEDDIAGSYALQEYGLKFYRGNGDFIGKIIEGYNLIPRPDFQTMWNNYPTYDITSQSLYSTIGGNFANEVLNQGNVAPGYENSCATRVSRALNLSGHTVKGGRKGGDGKGYFFRVSELSNYLTKVFGTPDYNISPSEMSQIEGKTGIIWFEVNYGVESSGNRATGHFTLFNGFEVRGGGTNYAGYIAKSVKIHLWLLK